MKINNPILILRTFFSQCNSITNLYMLSALSTIGKE